MEGLDEVTLNSEWQHYNGAGYIVLLLANEGSSRLDRPVTVVYQGPNGKVWARPLSDWHRSMKLMKR